MVHQHFMLVPVFSVTENVVLGFEPTRWLDQLDRSAARQSILDASARYGLDVDPDAVVEDLPVGIQQRVEILKALNHDADLLILDEPTAVLTPQEIDALMGIMRSLADAGKSILFISHKLREVRAISDVITVIRQGRVVGQALPSASEAELASLMVGRDVNLTVQKDAHEAGEPLLRVRDLVVRDNRGVAVVDHVSLDVRAGEIVALAGIQGNGQTEFVEALAGVRPVESGAIEMSGRDLTNHTPREILDAGFAHVPEDRQRDGLVLTLSVADNLVLNTPRREPFAHRGTRRLSAVRANADRRRVPRCLSAVRANADERINQFDIRTESAESAVGSLSGGNQQKVIVARELSRDADVIVAAQPTRGLDVGSIEYVHQQIVRQRNAGHAVLIVSSELDEVLALGDRVAVMHRGSIVGIVPPTTSREQIGLLMAGVSEETR